MLAVIIRRDSSRRSGVSFNLMAMRRRSRIIPIDKEGTTSQLCTTDVIRPRVRFESGIETVAGGPYV